MKCANCNQKECYKGKDCTNIAESVKDAYNEEALKSLKVATAIESRYYMQKTRIQELIIYAKEMGYTKLGVAFCIGLQTEAELICDVLSKHFTVSSVCCKVCGIDKSYFELERLHKRIELDTESENGVESEVEAMCNPIGQATLLNKEHTDLNIILGLCIGHDILFTNHSDAPVTTLAVKDRVLAHNPLGAIYSRYHLNRL
ncbi:putative metal-binding protein [Candidatus Methanophagaceae archaeon]|nr:putative metal-binding protein [Methanophagales archaeon]